MVPSRTDRQLFQDASLNFFVIARLQSLGHRVVDHTDCASLDFIDGFSRTDEICEKVVFVAVYFIGTLPVDS